jgi:hypothetical protein
VKTKCDGRGELRVAGGSRVLMRATSRPTYRSEMQAERPGPCGRVLIHVCVHARAWRP